MGIMNAATGIYYPNLDVAPANGVWPVEGQSLVTPNASLNLWAGVDVGFSLSGLLADGAGFLVERAIAATPLGPAAPLLRNIINKIGDISRSLGIGNTQLNNSPLLNIDQALRIEVNTPSIERWGALENWATDTVVHIKVDPDVFFLLPVNVGNSLLRGLGVNQAGIDVINRQRALPNNARLSDIRVTFSPGGILSGGLENADVRVGTMFLADTGRFNLPTWASAGQVEINPFLSFRYWGDGSVQIIGGLAAGANDGNNPSLLPGAFVEVAGAFNFKVGPGDFYRLPGGNDLAVAVQLNGRNVLVKLDSSILSKLPSNIGNQAIPLPAGDGTTIWDFEQLQEYTSDTALSNNQTLQLREFASATGEGIKFLSKVASVVNTATDPLALINLASSAAWNLDSGVAGIIAETPFRAAVENGTASAEQIAQKADAVWKLRDGFANNDKFLLALAGRFGPEPAAAIIKKLIFDGKMGAVEAIGSLNYVKEHPVRNPFTSLLPGNTNPDFIEFGTEILADPYFATLETVLKSNASELNVRDIVDLNNIDAAKSIFSTAISYGANSIDMALKLGQLRITAQQSGDIDLLAKADLAKASSREIIFASEIIGGLVSDRVQILPDGRVAYYTNNNNRQDFTSIIRNSATPWEGTLTYIRMRLTNSSLGDQNGNTVLVQNANGTSFNVPLEGAQMLDRIAYAMVSSGLDIDLGIPELTARIDTFKQIANGTASSTLVVDPDIRGGTGALRAKYPNGWMPASDRNAILAAMLKTNRVATLSSADFPQLALDPNGNPILGSVGPELSIISIDPAVLRQNALDAAATTGLNDIINNTQLTLEQKYFAAQRLLAGSTLSPEARARLQAIFSQTLEAPFQERGTLLSLQRETQTALRIARESNNQLGATLATFLLGAIDTLLAKVDQTTANARFSGGVNAIAAAANAAGMTFSSFVQMIGRGDLAAYGAVIGDVGELYKQLNLGGTGARIGAGFELTGSTLVAIGRQNNDRGMIIAGTAIGGFGGVLKATNDGTAGTAQTAGFAAAGQLATTIGQLGNSRELQALGVALNSAATLPGLFSNYRNAIANGGTPANGSLTDGRAAAAAAAGLFAQLIVGGRTGEILGNIGGLVSTGFQIAGNTVPGGAGALYVTAARQILNLVGVKIDATTNFALGTLSTALAGGPVAWGVWMAGVIWNLSQMGTFTKTIPLANNIDADGDGFNDDSASLRQLFRRDFFGGINLTKHNILYDVNGVDIRLLDKVEALVLPNFIVHGGDHPAPHQLGLYVNTTYRSINPSVSPTLDTQQIAMGSPLGQYLMQLIRSSPDRQSVAFAPNDVRLSNGSPLDAHLEGLTVRFTGARNDPNLYQYLDMNGDGTPDLVRMGLQVNGMRAQGDGKVEVTLLDANRQPIGINFTTNNFTEAEQIGLNYKELLAWAASRAPQYGGVIDMSRIYREAVASGAVAKMAEARTKTLDILDRLMRQQPVDLVAEYAAVAKLTAEAGITFKGAAYLEANADVAAWAGGDPTKAAIHYLLYGFREARALEPPPSNATVVMPTPDPTPPPVAVITPPPLPPLGPNATPLERAQRGWLANRTHLGTALNSSNGIMRLNQYITSADGRFVTLMSTGSRNGGGLQTVELNADGTINRVVWRSFTADSPNWLVAPSNAIQRALGINNRDVSYGMIRSDGNLVMYNNVGEPVWASRSGSPNADRSFALVVQNDGVLAAVDSQGNDTIWSSAAGLLSVPEPDGVVQAPIDLPVNATPAQISARALQLAQRGWLSNFTSVGTNLGSSAGILRAGQYMASENGQYVTVFVPPTGIPGQQAPWLSGGYIATYELNQSNGTIGRTVWSSANVSSPNWIAAMPTQDEQWNNLRNGTLHARVGEYAVISPNGNFTIYNNARDAIWSTRSGSPDANRPFNIVIQSDGNLVLVDSQGNDPIWSNATGLLNLPEPNVTGGVLQPIP